MACKLIVVMSANDLGFDDFRQVRKAFAVQHSINFLQNLFQALFPNFYNNLVYCL